MAGDRQPSPKRKARGARAEPPRKRTVKADDSSPTERRKRPKDPLGKLLKEHSVTLAGVLVISIGFSLLGIAALGYALTQNPPSTLFLVIGGAIILCALVLFSMNIFNIGKSLQLRKRGVRFTTRGHTTELLWEDIVDVAVHRHDETNLGVVKSVRDSSDAVSPSGLLTKSEWHVVLHGSDGTEIELTPSFMRMVDKPQELVSMLRLRSGI